MAPKKQNKAKKYSCPYCSRMDNQNMVKCVDCQVKFHKRCIDNSLIEENGLFICEACFALNRQRNKERQNMSSQLNKGDKSQQFDKSNEGGNGSHINASKNELNVVDKLKINSQVSDNEDNRTNYERTSKRSQRSSTRRNQQIELARLEELEQLRLQNVSERRNFIETKYQLMREDGESSKSTDRSSFTKSWVSQHHDGEKTMIINPKPNKLPKDFAISKLSQNNNNEFHASKANKDNQHGFRYIGFRSNSLDDINPRMFIDARRQFIKKIDLIQLDDDSQRQMKEIGLSNNESAPPKLNSRDFVNRPPECPLHDAKQHMFRNEVFLNIPKCRANVDYEDPRIIKSQGENLKSERERMFNNPELDKRKKTQSEEVQQSTPKFSEQPDIENFKQYYRQMQSNNQTFDIPTESNNNVEQNHGKTESGFIKFIENQVRQYREIEASRRQRSRNHGFDEKHQENHNFFKQPANQQQFGEGHHGFDGEDVQESSLGRKIFRSSQKEEEEYDDVRELEYPVNVNRQRKFNHSENHQINSSEMKMEDYFKNDVVLTHSQIAARQVVDRKLPKFDGNPIEWSAWFQKVLNTTKMCGLNNQENLERLEKCLEKKARDYVVSQLSYPQSVPWIMATLKLLFGRPEVIIRMLIDKIKELPPVKAYKIESLMEFAFEVYNISGTIESLAEQNNHFMTDPMLVEELVNKLPAQEKKEWARYKLGRSNVTLRTLASWLYELANVLSTVSAPITTKFNDKKSDNPKFINKKSDKYSEKELVRINVHTDSYPKQNSEDTNANLKQVKSPRKPACVVCNKGCARIENCQKFKSLSVDLRWKIVIDNKLCYKCMRKHKFPCKSTIICEENGCQYKKKHHSLLHNGDRHCVPKNQTQNDSNDNIVPVSANIHNDVNKSTMLRIVPVALYHNEKTVNTFAFLDEGSTTSMMEQAVADELGLSGTPEMLCLIWTKNIHRQERAQRVNLEISAVKSSRKYSLNGVRTVSNLDLPIQSVNKDELVRSYPFLKAAKFESYDNAKPTILIGSDNPKLGIQKEVIEGPDENCPVASKTKLGWTVHGPTNCSSDKQYVNIHEYEVCSEHNECDSNIHKQIKEYFSIENFGVQVNKEFNGESQENQRAMELLEKNTIKINGKYETGLLWKQDKFDVPDSYQMAMRRLVCLEKQGAKMVKAVGDKIDEYVAKNYARKLTPEELKENRPVWYLPPFGVVHPKKPEKLRMVFDAAAKVKKTSLNSYLLKGPDLITSLVDILRRFRERLIAICGDICEMYHQIKVNKTDQQFQRFLFRHGDSQREPDVYVMLVMIFGATCAPFIAQYIKNRNASEFKETHPEAVKSIIENHYVDDMMDGEHSEEAAIKLLQDVKMIHAHGGFEIRNFLSNSPNVLKAMKADEINNSKSISPNSETNVERVLGMWWDTKSDVFTFSLKYAPINEDILHGRKLPTKREILRTLMSIFDPLGLLSNYLIHLKIIMQETWRSEIGWDQQISSDSLIKSWKQWLEILPQVENVRIPRLLSPKISPGIPKSVQLHVFVDASVDAFSALVYLRVEDDNGIDCALIGSKAKVAPLKYLSIPRLELMAAVLGKRLAISVGNAQRLKIDRRIFWSDSETVLSWLKSNHKKYSQFVAHRVGEILEGTDVNEWRWIPTKENVADEATKWAKPITFESSNRWFSGPDFIRQSEDHWPEKRIIKANVQEEMKAHFIHSSLVIPQLIDSTRFSKWSRMVRALAYSLRFRRLFNGKAKRGSPLSQEELIKAENLLFRQAQFEGYPAEMVTLERNKVLPLSKRKFIEKPSPLFEGTPYLDADGVLRMKGRIDGARGLSMDTKRPIVLPKDNHITKLLVLHYHNKFYHQTHETAINEIRQRFYVPRLRVTLKKVKKNCQSCKVKKAHVNEPQMADLPPARLSVGFRAFSFVGIDFFGPMKVLIGRRVEKRWGVIFTCLTIRAIHIEIASSLDTNTCILCIQNFVADRGPVIEFHSDCGTNFIGANNELQQELQKLDKDQLETEFTTTYSKWIFNPPSAPHMGGHYERLIAIVKSGIDEIMPTRTPKEDVLRNILKGVQNVVNSRPLTYVPLEVEDDEALTPNHFLLGSSNGLKPPCKLELEGEYLRQSWKEAQRLTEIFWKRFAKEYLPTLARRTKWFKPVPPIKEGDLVLVIDGDNPRNTYPKATVIETKVGSNEQVRRAKIKYITEAKTDSKGKICRIRTNSVWRPAHKLAVLDVQTKEVANTEEDRVIDGIGSVDVAAEKSLAQLELNSETGGSVGATKLKSNAQDYDIDSISTSGKWEGSNRSKSNCHFLDKHTLNRKS